MSENTIFIEKELSVKPSVLSSTQLTVVKSIFSSVFLLEHLSEDSWVNRYLVGGKIKQSPNFYEMDHVGQIISLSDEDDAEKLTAELILPKEENIYES